MKVSDITKRFHRQIKRLSKLDPKSAASKKLRPLAEVELMKLLATGGKRAAESAVSTARVGAHKLKVAEKKGHLTKWRNRIGLGLQLIEVAVLATAAVKGTSVKVGPAAKRPAPAKRGHVRKKGARSK